MNFEKKRILIAQIVTETCSFNPVKTELSDFIQCGLGLGKDVIKSYGDVDEIGGFLAGIKKWKERPEIIGLVRAQASSGGKITEKTFKFFKKELLKRIKSAGQTDGLLLALHGAQMSEGDPDGAGSLIKLCRNILGKKVPIIVTFDLHANITRKMIKNADAIIGFHTSPHIDRAKTGVRAAEVLYQILFKGAKPEVFHVKMPMITEAELHNTFNGPPSPMYKELIKLEDRKKILNISIFMSQPWYDAKGNGWSVLVTTNNNKKKSKAIAERLAQRCWKIRKKMHI